jgi:hypothetical protein
MVMAKVGVKLRVKKTGRSYAKDEEFGGGLLLGANVGATN